MRKSTKCPHKIIAHSLITYMEAMAWPRARLNVLHPRQYGGINLERAYSRWHLDDENIELSPYIVKNSGFSRVGKKILYLKSDASKTILINAKICK
jgi:hypothetical protein